MEEKSVFCSKTLSLDKAIDKYLENVTDRSERSLLNRFKIFMDKKNRRYDKVDSFTNEDFNNFLKSLSSSKASFKSNASRLNRFKAYIGLSKKKVKENRNPMEIKNPQLEKKLAEKEEALTLHRKTVDTKDAEIKKLQGIIDTLKSKGMEIEEIRHLEQKKTDLEKELAEMENSIENQRIFEVECPLGKGLVSLGNDCHSCNDYVSCPLSSRRPDLLYVKDKKPEEEEECD